MADITSFIRPKSVPLRSIHLSKIDENHPSHKMHCNCAMCNQYQSKKIAQLLQVRTKNINEKICQKIKYKHCPTNTFYIWLIKHLTIPSNKIIKRGLDVYIPQVLFYKEGEPNKLFCLREIDDPVVKVAHKEKLSSTFILKIFGDRRRKYREIINAFLGRKKQVVIKKPSFGAKKQPKRESKDGVIIKYTDGLQQLISQNQFLHLLQRRKQDPLWRQIYYIKNYIPVEQSTMDRITVIRYNKDDIKYQHMWKRAKTLMKVYGQNIMENQSNYITDREEGEFCKALIKEGLHVFCEYIVYKIVCFVQYFYDEKIKEVVVKMFVNQMGQVFLEDVMKLKTETLTKFQWTNQTYLRKIDEEEQRVFFSKQVCTDQNIQKNAADIQQVMGKTYEKMKQFYGLSMEEEDDNQQKANDQFFKLIHPQIQVPMSQILRYPGMTVQKVKKDFLGYKPKKKPIVKPFNSNMIKSLHNMTPQFHRADPHQFVKIPRRTLSTAFSRSSSYQHKSFSMKKNHSGFSTNVMTAFSSPRTEFK